MQNHLFLPVQIQNDQNDKGRKSQLEKAKGKDIECRCEGDRDSE